jgi:putative Holliday junction resolvase
MRVLALDPGTQRIGVALSDELGVIAQPMGYWPAESMAGIIETLREWVKTKEVGLILVGLPRNMDGSLGPAARQAEQFMGRIRAAIPVPVQPWDERLTTAQASRLLIESGVRRNKRKEKVDSLAAAIMLQSYLDARAQQP